MSVGAGGPLVVTYPLSERSRAIVAEELGGAAAAVYLADLAPPERAAALRGAGALLAHDTSKELASAEIPLIRNAKLLQFTAAGIDQPYAGGIADGCQQGRRHRADVRAHRGAGARRRETPVHRARQSETGRLFPRLIARATARLAVTGVYSQGSVGGKPNMGDRRIAMGECCLEITDQLQGRFIVLFPRALPRPHLGS
jgi:hypothetical protein